MDELTRRRLTIVAGSLVLLALAAGFLVRSDFSRALPDVTVGIGSGEVAAGGSIPVPVNVSGASSLGAATIEVQYDPAVLDATACNMDPGSIFDAKFCNLAFDNDNVNPDSVRFNVVSLSGASGNFTLANLTFQATGQPGESSTLGVVVQAFADPNGNPIAFSAQGGSICITPCTAGTPTPQRPAPQWFSFPRSADM